MAEVGDETVSELNQKYEQAKSARLRYEPDWMLNRAFYEGNQWVYVSGHRLTRPHIDPRRQLVTDNRIKPVVTSRVARKAKNRPNFSATPQGADDASNDAARVGERCLENDWEALHLQPKLFSTLLWADVCCDGFLKTYWDGTKGQKTDYLTVDGEPLRNPQDGTPLRPEEIEVIPPEVLSEIQDKIQVKSVAQGDLCVEIKTPFEIYPDPLATSMEDIEWLIDETIRSVEYVRKHYPTTANGEAFDPHADSEIPDSPGQGYVQTGTLYSGSTAEYRGVRVREYWCKPNTKHPNGWYAVWANDTLLVADEPFDPMPYVKFGSTEVPGRFWSRAVTTDLRGPQEDLNILQTQIKENARRVGNPAILKSRQANVRFQGLPGEEILYDSTVSDAVPQYLEPPSIPPYVENQVERIEKSIEEISGMHEVSRATVPTGVTAASAINLLQEADETRIGPEIQQMEFALGQLGTKMLQLRAAFNTDERLLKIAGQDGNWDIQSFKGEMLGDDPHVEVQAGSQMPRSKAAKQAAMTEVLGLMLQYGVPIDERNMRKFLKDYEVGGLDRLFEGFSEDAKQTNREHRILIEGIIDPLPINSFDNHEFHIAEHTEFQKSHRYYYLPDDAKARFDSHVAAHRAYMVQMVENQLETQSEEAQAGQQEQMAMDIETDVAKEAAKAEFAPNQNGASQ